MVCLWVLLWTLLIKKKLHSSHQKLLVMQTFMRKKTLKKLVWD